MSKSRHNYGFSDIPKTELVNFINPINMSIKIEMESIPSIFNNYVNVSDYIKEFYKDVFTLIPSMPDTCVRWMINNCLSMSYTPHTSGYDFRFSPIQFVNDLFTYMKIDYQVPFVNLDNGYGMNYLKDYIRAYINDFKRNPDNVNRTKYDLMISILDELNTNLDQIVHMYYTSLDNLIDKYVIPKDMLLYLAFESLHQYESTKDDNYLVLPYEYYHYVSHMRTSPYPHMIMYDGAKRWFSGFRTQYESSVGKELIIDDSPYRLNDHELLLAWDILKPGMLERKLRDTCEFVKSSPNVDYAKYLELFERKMNYYMSSPYKNYIQGKYGLNGYVGFSYENEYLVFDKFHNSETIDQSKKTILTHGEAIYALPSDRFNIVKGTKQDIIQAKQKDERIKKVNHTPNYSFFGKLDNIIEGPNVSFTTFDKVIEKEKKRILINR